jgi:CheY-like chemotaxis protein
MSADARRSARHLLIVDDEPVILQILRAVFDDEPHRLTCVSTGREALAIIEEQGCDVLLTDKNLRTSAAWTCSARRVNACPIAR